MLRPAGGRNAAAVLETDGVPGWVLKPGDDAEREAEMLLRLADTPLRDAVPRVRHAGPDGLVTAALDGVPGDAVPAPASEHLAALGAFMRVLHRMPAPAAAAVARPPWVTRLHRPTPRRLAWSSAAVVRLIREVQADDAMCDALDALAASWRPEGLVHGDLRLSNVLVRVDGRIAVVDWEAAGGGPGSMDAGWLAGDLLLRWGVAMDPRLPSEALMLRSGGPALMAACGAAGALWSAYGGRDAAEMAGWAGARLLQAAAEECQHELFPPEGTRAVLLAARLVLTRPEEFAGRITGSP